MSLWLAVARADAGLAAAPGRLGALAALLEEMDARCGSADMAGRAGIIEGHKRLAAVLAAVDPAEVERLLASLGLLTRELEFAGRTLARLREAKAAFDGEPA